MADLGLYEAVWSSWIIAELNRVLTVLWLRETHCDLSIGALRAMSVRAKAMMRIMLGTFIHVDPPIPHEEPWDSLADQDDAPIWAAAVTSHAQYVVSCWKERSQSVWQGSLPAARVVPAAELLVVNVVSFRAKHVAQITVRRELGGSTRHSVRLHGANVEVDPDRKPW